MLVKNAVFFYHDSSLYKKELLTDFIGYFNMKLNCKLGEQLWRI